MRWPWVKKQKEAPQDLTGPGVPAFEEHSPTWQWLRKEIEQKLQQARTGNDSVSRDQIQTAYLRGRISVYKELLALPAAEKNARQQAAHTFRPVNWPDEE